MTSWVWLLSPSANRAYAESVVRLAGAELRCCVPEAGEVRAERVAGADCLAFEAPADVAPRVARLSAHLALFERVEGGLLRGADVAPWAWLDEDLVTIPKYPGKTNEQFTAMLLGVTMAALDRPPGRRTVLDPMCGRGTTLTTAWRAGHDACGVEADTKAVEQLNAFLRTWLRRKRIKHALSWDPVRREGRSLGRRLTATARPESGELTLTVFTGDTRDSAALFGKRRFDAVVVDAPYGVAHGATTDVRGTSGKRDRSPAGLLAEALPVWAGQLRPGGALGISWNTHGLTRERLAELAAGAGLEPLDEEPWSGFDHRVDSSIQRDILVARRPAD